MIAPRSRRQPGQPRVTRTVTRDWLLRCNLTIRIYRIGRKKPLIGDASIARVGELVEFNGKLAVVVA